VIAKKIEIYPVEKITKNACRKKNIKKMQKAD